MNNVTIICKSINEYKEKLSAIKVLDLEIESTELRGYFSQEPVKETKETNSPYMVNKYGIQNDDFFRAESYFTVESVGNVWIQIAVGTDKGECRFPSYPEVRSYSEEAKIVITCTNKGTQ